MPQRRGSFLHLPVFVPSDVTQGSLILKILVIAPLIIKPCFQFDLKLNTHKKRLPNVCFKTLITYLSIIYSVPRIRKLQNVPYTPEEY